MHWLSLALVLTIPLTAAAPEPPDEYRVKAAFLFNFARFVEWPPEAFTGPYAPLVLCVLGEDPLGRALDEAVADKKIDGRAIAVRRFSDARQSKGCRMLFVAPSERRRTLSVLEALDEPGLLTVGESDSPTAEGLVIIFVLEAGKVRFAINVTAAEREKLHVSSRLLSLAATLKR